MSEWIHLNDEHSVIKLIAQINILRVNIYIGNEKRYTQFEVKRQHINSPLTKVNVCVPLSLVPKFQSVA